MQLLKHFFFYDSLHKRVDVHRYITYVIIAGIALIWALMGNPTLKQYASRLLIGLAFMCLVRVCLVRLSASRLSSVVLSVMAFIVLAGLRPRALVEIGMFIGFLLVCLEFCKLRTKFAAIAAGVILGLLAAGAGVSAKAMIILFILFLTTRLIWHIGLERISKVELVLFAAKIIVASAIALALYYGLRDHIDFPWSGIGYVPVPHVSAWVLVPLGLLALRGLWGTLLLETERSPQGRGIRMYLAFTSVIVWFTGLFVQHLGNDVFAVPFLSHLAAIGLTSDNIQIHVFGLYAILLFASEGIDRSLNRNTTIGRSVGRAVGILDKRGAKAAALEK